MAALQRKLVHKQFNSPMGLYSQENVKATLNRELKAFGGEGIEVDDQITKPLNLANSAVLRAVEEEEQQAKCGYKRVAWPPASEERIIREFTPQPQTQSPAPGAGGYYPQAHAPTAAAAAPPQEPLQAVNNVGGGWKHIGAPQPKSRSEFTAGNGAYPPFQGSYQQQQPQQQQQQYGAPSYDGQQQQPAAQWQQQQQYQPQSQAQAPYQPPQWNQPQQQQQQQPSYQASPYQQQQQQQQPSYYPQQNGGSTYAQPPYNSYSQPQLPYSQDQTDLQQQQQQQQQQQYPGAYAGQDSYRGASPGIITLRKEAPVSQKPAPVYTSQPAAVSYQGGSKLRGDLKWPPPEYKEAAARENEERRQLALGPVCRPRRVNRQDYTPFFAKHQLNNGYPSYKVPPGTQHIFG
ncbi:chromatin modification-related protein EAF1 isoform X7 [Drosophila mauritiana]|uniref:Chromatin modification-related protein EAF1 isoform X7 n=1 Tax=Drosophila mauritiana TaxID=7226 RepID=A0A6P8K6G8_DROMA|nr:chromatin modification-related protein EAF1 isoform X7 [Drosophila mauritiana]